MQTKTLFRTAALIGSAALSIALVMTPASARKAEKGVESAHQPQVSRTDFVFDVASGSDGALGDAEARRLSAWFDALGLRYGDHVTLAGAKGMAGVRDGVGEIVGRYGLLTEGDAPVTAGSPPAGSIRVVVSRSTAAVPGCPSWRDRTMDDLAGAQGDDYGCAVATNLAAMVADPQDLIRGRSTTTDLRTATGSRAIQTYQNQTPTGAGGLQVMSAGGK